MKKIVLFLGILFVTCLVTQAQEDIFKKHGITKEPLTLSKGKYKETFYNEEIMQIGTVKINTLTGKVVEFLEPDTTEFAYRAEVTSRFLTVDPLCEEYYSWSPYVYVKDNPMKYIDPDGRKLVIANNAAGAMENIAKIAATSFGGQIVNHLISASETYAMKGVFWSSNSRYDPNSRTISYVESPWYDEVPYDGGALTSMTAMGHETMHGYDHSNTLFNAKNAGLSKDIAEPRAVSFANYLREAYSLSPSRNQYGSIKGDFHQFATGGNEKISNFSTLGNNKDKTSYGFSYTKTTKENVLTVIGYPTGEMKTVVKNYYMVVSMDKDKNATYQIYDNVDEYKKATSNW